MRHSDMGERTLVRVEGTASLEAVPGQAWDALVGDRTFYLSHAWLCAQDRDQPVAPRYLLARWDGRLAGALPTYLVARETNDFYRPERCIDGRWRGRYLLAGGRRAYANELLLAADVPAETRRQALRALTEALLARVEAAGVDRALFLYLSTDAARELRAARPEVEPFLAGADAAIDLPGTGMDDYLAAFSSRRRVRLRHEMAVFQEAGYDTAIERAADCWEEMARLLANVQQKYGHAGDERHWRGVLSRQARALDRDAVVFTCRAGGALAGACLAYPWRGRLYVRLVGFDYQRLRGAFEYFNLVFYRPLEFAYERGLRQLHLGRESYDAKVRRGARLVPQWHVELAAAGGRAAGEPAAVWNNRAGLEWRAQFGSDPGVLSDPGWSAWDCAGPPDG